MSRIFKSVALITVLSLIFLAVSPASVLAAPKKSTSAQGAVSCSIDTYPWNSYGYYTPYPYSPGAFYLNSVIRVNCTGPVSNITLNVYSACGTTIYHTYPTFTSRTFYSSCFTMSNIWRHMSVYASYWNGSSNTLTSALISIR